jgi:hypothetical protein
MSSTESQTWQKSQTGIAALVLVAFFILIFVGGRPFFRSTSGDIKTTVQDVGHDLKSAGRDAADSIRRTVQ